ncbi:MAG: hypothetical protein V4595_01220 [Pseudomonadota bacterium]|jgi:hypothetical protein
MHNKVQAIARLKSMVFLIEEALRIADEGDSALLGAKLSDCIDCLQSALVRIGSQIDPGRRIIKEPLPIAPASLAI